MKVLTTLLAATLIFAAPPIVQNARAQGEFWLGVGMNAPQGEFGDETNNGFALTSGLGIRPLPLLLVGVELNYYGNKAADEVVEAVGPDIDMSLRILQYGGVVKALLPVLNHHVYAKGNVGYYRGTAKVSSPLGEAKVSNNELGFGIGGGLMINGSKNSALYMEIIRHHIRYDDADIDTNFLTFSAGAVFSFDLVKNTL
jgi:hypothetical protein